METKEQLINNIKEWIKIDNEVSKLNLEIKTRKNRKKELTVALVETMKKNTIDCFDISGGSLIYKKNTVKKAINAKSLLVALKNYYKDTPQVADELTKHILDSREEVVKETIQRKVDKIQLPTVEA
jgi:hypothetical protein